jgi:Flp pilus assembly protein TadG
MLTWSGISADKAAMGARIRHAGRVLTSSRSRTERGAALVEFAIILPVFMIIVLGMFSGAVAYNS